MSRLTTLRPSSTRRVARRAAVALTLLALPALGASCSKSSSPTAPTVVTESTTTTAEAAAPTMTEVFTTTLPVGGSRFYSFYVSTRGTVNVTLKRIGGTQAVPDSVWIRLGVGKPDATDCVTSTTKDTQSGDEPQISLVLETGTHCAKVADIGNLAVPATFAVTIDHP